MLHILLSLLKIIGIIIAVILGIVLLIICVVFFASLRYEVSAAAEGDVKSLKANVKFSWLFRLISGYVDYEEEKLNWQVKVAWKKLNVEKPVEDSAKPEESARKDTDTKEAPKEVPKELPKVDSKKEIKKESKKESKKETKKDSKVEKKTKKPKKEKEQKEKLSDKINMVKDFIQAQPHKMAFQKLLRELLRVIKKLKPKKLRANVEFGFEDPYTTGNILAYLSILYPFYGDNISIVPNFEEPIMKGDVFIKGYVRISYFVNMGIRLILNKNIRITIKDIMKLISKK